MMFWCSQIYLLVLGQNLVHLYLHIIHIYASNSIKLALWMDAENIMA